MRIEDRIDYIINTIEKTEKNVDEFIKAYHIKDFKTLNLINIKLTYDDYLYILKQILSSLIHYIKNNNQNKSKKMIEFFLDYYYIYKNHNIKESKLINDYFLELCNLYNQKFLNNEYDLNKIKVGINKFFNNEVNIFDIDINGQFLDLNKSYKQIFASSFFGDEEDFNIIKIFNSLLKECYNNIRKNKSSKLYYKINDLVEFFLSNNFNSIIYYRILSFISLKNDILLQENLNKEQIDLYYKENKKFIENIYWTDSGGETLQKLGENLIKVQFAYNLLGVGRNIQKDYLFVQEYLNKNFNYFNIFIKKSDYIYNINEYLLLVFAYILFVDAGKINPKNIVGKISYKSLLIIMKQYKYKHYKLKGILMFISDLIFYKKYNFIY